MKSSYLAALLMTLWFPGGAFGWTGYLRLDGVTGEVQEENHVGWMEISSADVANLANADAATGGKNDQGPFYFAKNLDHASPALQLDCAQGTRILSGALDLVDTNSLLPFFRLNLTNIFVTKVSIAGQAGNGDRPQEVIGLEAQITAWHYMQFNTASGLPANYVNSQWDFSRNTGTGGAQPPAFLMSGIRQAAGVQLNWQATAGKRYGIYAVSQLGQPFTLVAVVTAAATGAMTSTQPMNGNAMFFIVQELPE